MIASKATDVRKDWSSVVDSVVRDKPRFIRRTRDCLMLSDVKLIESILAVYQFSAHVFDEDDGTVTLSLDEIDLVENAEDVERAVAKLARGILEYAEDFYDDYAYWAVGKRKSHIPYVIKALIINDAAKIGGMIQCQRGEI